MKQFANGLVAVTSITVILAMSSCKKEINQPDLPTHLPVENAGSPVGGAQRPTTMVLLSKENNKTLSYYLNKKVASVNYGNGHEKKYTYSSQFSEVIADLTYNGKKTQQITYLLDNTGKATKMKVKGYDANGSAVVFNGEYQFSYLNGKLAEQKGTLNFSDGYKFLYDDEGRLKWVETYNSLGKLTKKSRYFYKDYSLQPEIADKIQLNPRDAGIDDYLKIFGKFSLDLIKMMDVYKYENDNLKTIDTYVFTYQLDFNGYAKKREKTMYGFGPAVLETINYDYIIQ